MIRIALLAFLIGFNGLARGEERQWVKVSQDKKGFTLEPSGRAFVPWGFNYDHDTQGRLIEDYWDSDWPVRCFNDWRRASKGA
jgi:hypothetical protein